LYFLVNMGLLSFASGVEGHESPWAVFHERFRVAAAALRRVRLHRRGHGHRLHGRRPSTVLAVLRRAAPPDAQDAGGVPQAHAESPAQKAARGGGGRSSLRTCRSSRRTRHCASARRRRWSRCRPRSTRRDSYTAGHSRPCAAALARDRPRARALSARARAARVTRRSSTTSASSASPDAILLKPASLTPEEWVLMQRHAEEGARIIDRLGFLEGRGAGYPPPS